jgi:hypothetical protein
MDFSVGTANRLMISLSDDIAFRIHNDSPNHRVGRGISRPFCGKFKGDLHVSIGALHGRLFSSISFSSCTKSFTSLNSL